MTIGSSPFPFSLGWYRFYLLVLFRWVSLSFTCNMYRFAEISIFVHVFSPLKQGKREKKFGYLENLFDEK